MRDLIVPTRGARGGGRKEMSFSVSLVPIMGVVAVRSLQLTNIHLRFNLELNGGQVRERLKSCGKYVSKADV